MPRKAESAVARAQRAKRETRNLDFKECFHPDSTADWTELVKDFMAMANSGGGIIVVGVCNDGTPASESVTAVLELDPAKITDKVERYTGVQFAEVEINDATRGRKKVAVIEIGAAREAPIAFIRPGTYPVEGGKGKQKTAFAQGTVYFRHGAKSEPGTNADMRAFIDRRLDEVRESWFGRMRRVIEAPEDARLATVQSVDEGGVPTEIRLTDDPNALVYGKLDPDKTHPYRQKELMALVNAQLPPGARVNSRDMYCVRKVHDLMPWTAPQFMYGPKYGSWQYSEAYAQWLLDQYASNKDFFQKARGTYGKQP
jgi:Putative DNA-binding domain/EC042_2821-lke REase